MVDGNQGRFGPLLRSMRERRDLSLRELARRAGISSTYLSVIERNQAPPPSNAKIERIAMELELDPTAMVLIAGRIPADLLSRIQNYPFHASLIITYLGFLAPSKADELVETARKLMFKDLPYKEYYDPDPLARGGPGVMTSLLVDDDKPEEAEGSDRGNDED